MWNNAEHLEAYLAIPSMGAVLHTLNLRLSADQVGYIATHAGDYAVIVDASLIPLFAKVLPLAETIRHVIVSGPADEAALAALAGHGREVHSYEELLAAAPDAFDWPELDERSAAAMCYTSGTTGLPKGVAYSHRSTYLHSMAACTMNGLGVGEHDRIMPIVPQFHANAWGLPYAAMMSGADLVMPDRFMIPAAIVKLIETEKVTVGAGVPTIWQGVLAHLRDVRRRHLLAAHPGLRRLGAAGGGDARLRRRVRHHHDARLGDDRAVAPRLGRPRARGRHRRGGLAVPGVPGAADLRRRGPADRGRRRGAARPTARPWASSRCRGPWITASYYKDAAPEKFHDGWLRTGDVGTLDAAGFLRLTDRAKDVIKSGGEWISSMELENLIMAHPAVAEAAVIGVPDEKWGERPLAAVVLRAGRGPGDPGRAARLPGRADPALAAPRALVLHRRGAEDLGRQVQEDHPAGPVRGGRPRRDEAGAAPALSRQQDARGAHRRSADARADGRRRRSLCRAPPVPVR